MDIPTRIEVNCTTGEVTEHELTDAEIAQREADAIAADLERVAREDEVAAKDALKASAKAKLIAGTPLTAEEADTLVF